MQTKQYSQVQDHVSACLYDDAYNFVTSQCPYFRIAYPLHIHLYPSHN